MTLSVRIMGIVNQMYFFLLSKHWPTHLTYNIFLTISLIVPRAGRCVISYTIPNPLHFTVILPTKFFTSCFQWDNKWFNMSCTHHICNEVIFSNQYLAKAVADQPIGSQHVNSITDDDIQAFLPDPSMQPQAAPKYPKSPVIRTSPPPQACQSEQSRCRVHHGDQQGGRKQRCFNIIRWIEDSIWRKDHTICSQHHTLQKFWRYNKV